MKINPALMANEPVYSVEGRDYNVKLLKELTDKAFTAEIVSGPDTGKWTTVAKSKLKFVGNNVIPLWEKLSEL